MLLKEGERLETLGGGIRAIVTADHTFGADALMLASFALKGGRPRRGNRLCDLGTGCGIIPLLWCRGSGEFTVDAVEIQREAAELAVHAAELNGLQNRIRVVCGDLKTPFLLPRASYDLVCSNPPYKKAGTGEVSGSEAQRLARHEICCTTREIIEKAADLLKNGGTFCLCQRPERLSEVLCWMQGCGLEPKRLRFVQQRAETRPWLFLVEGKKGAKPGLLAEPVLLIKDGNGKDTPEVQKLYTFD